MRQVNLSGMNPDQTLSDRLAQALERIEPMAVSWASRCATEKGGFSFQRPHKDILDEAQDVLREYRESK